MVAHDEYRAALKEYQIAQHHFDQADPEHVDVAIHRLRAAELRLEAVLMQLKKAKHKVKLERIFERR